MLRLANDKGEHGSDILIDLMVHTLRMKNNKKCKNILTVHQILLLDFE
jgi:hypothetical protein